MFRIGYDSLNGSLHLISFFLLNTLLQRLETAIMNVETHRIERTNPNQFPPRQHGNLKITTLVIEDYYDFWPRLNKYLMFIGEMRMGGFISFGFILIF